MKRFRTLNKALYKYIIIIIIILDLCLRKFVQGNHLLIATPSLSKISVFKMLSVHAETQNRVVEILRFEKRFRNAPFSCRISVDGRP